MSVIATEAPEFQQWNQEPFYIPEHEILTLCSTICSTLCRRLHVRRILRAMARKAESGMRAKWGQNEGKLISIGWPMYCVYAGPVIRLEEEYRGIELKYRQNKNTIISFQCSIRIWKNEDVCNYIVQYIQNMLIWSKIRNYISQHNI